jgi:hypothetical protein
MIMKKPIVLTIVVCLILGFGFLQPLPTQASGAPGKEKHPLIRKAIAACENAAVDLEDASHDFCGHREAALDADEAAINQLLLALACDPNASTQTVSFMKSAAVQQEQDGFTITAKKEKHPLIRKAIAALENAAVDLEDAAHDFCGHREAALDKVNAAIVQLGEALGCDPH